MFDAGGFPDIGPDASVEAAQTPRTNGEALSRMLAGKTLFYGETAIQGPYRIRLNADGSAVVLRGREPIEFDTGSWNIREDKFCRDWKKIEPRQMCLTATSDGSSIQLFDGMGLMFIDARIVDN